MHAHRRLFCLVVSLLFFLPSKIREQLGMKPVPRDKFSSFSPRETDGNRKNRVSVSIVSLCPCPPMVQCMFLVDVLGQS